MRLSRSFSQATVIMLSWLACFQATGTAAPPSPLPIMGIAHVAYQSSHLEISQAFYTGMLGFELAFKIEDPAPAWYIKVNDDQFVKLVAVPGPAADDRLVEVALQVSDVDRTWTGLRARGLEPTPIQTQADGTRATSLHDPEGHLLRFVEYTPESQQSRHRGRHLGARRAATRLWHTGITVTDEARAREFYETKLGGQEFWRGGPEGQPTTWVNVRLPGNRGDYLEYMLHHGPVSRERLSSMHHICFQTDDLRDAHRALCNHGLQDIERYHPRIGRNQHWLCNVYDPDGTRLELMEAQPVPGLTPPLPGSEPRYFGARPGALTQTKARLAAGDPLLAPAYAKLLADAHRALQVKPPTVTDKKRPGASGDVHDFASQAPYLWPDPNTATGLPYVPRDGVVNPESANPDFTDRSRLGLLGQTVETLALAYTFTGNEAYAEHAARCLRVWFIDPTTRMNPNFDLAQAVPGRNTGRGIGLISGGALVDAADAAGLLWGSPAWSTADARALHIWVTEFIDWMRISANGHEEASMRQNHGTMYDFKLVRLALIAGRTTLAKQILASVATNRIALQIEPDGAQTMELRRTKSFGYSRLNLNGLVELAVLGERLHVDLWNFETPDGRGIRRAINFMLPYAKTPPEKWPYEQIVPFNQAELAPIFRAAALAYGDPRYEQVVTSIPEAQEALFQLLQPSPKP